MNKEQNNKPEFWRSVEEAENGRSKIQSFLAEFPEKVKKEFDINQMSPVSRRKFLALLGASSAFALTSCNDYRDRGEIISYNDKQENTTFGEALYYASALNDGTSILVKTREGRPIAIEGNPEHPIYKGKVTTQHHAEIFNLYDPERLKEPLRKSDSKLILNENDMKKVKWDLADKEIVSLLKKSKENNKKIAIVTHSVISPSQKKVFDDFINSYPNARIYSYELFNDKNRIEAWKQCFNNENIPSINWDKANVILALESDFLGNEGNTIENSRKFSSRRNVDEVDNFSRLYVAEANMSLTGMNADYRMMISPEYQLDFILSLSNELVKQKNISIDSKTQNLIDDHTLSDFIKKNNIDEKTIHYLVKDLIDNMSHSLIYAGDKLPIDVHIAVNMLNEILENKEIYNFKNIYKRLVNLSSISDFTQLVSDMNANEVDFIIHFDSNPVYHLPKDLGYDEALKKVETVVSLTSMPNESTMYNTFILPINHSLESWNDFENTNSLLTLQQPVIAPLYNTRQKEAILLNWLSNKPENYEENIYNKFINSRLKTEVYPKLDLVANFERFWYASLHDGFINLNNNLESKPNFVLPSITNNYSKKDFTLILTNNYSVDDGKYSNNGWLQELPHPISKVTWDNYVAISPKTAKELNLENYDVIELVAGNRKIKMPILKQPGIAEKTLAIELGYGRNNAGTVASDVGVNANLLMSKDTNYSEWIYTGVTINKTSEVFEIYSTQEHHPLDEDFVKDFQYKRDIIQQTTVQEYKKNPSIIKDRKPEIENMYPLREYPDAKWAMAIDMNKCIGCSNCIISCEVENNIPVVGKEQVGKGREMQWIRLDRYYSGTVDNPIITKQPMLCQQCDNAPCENVCPVAATNHSEDGLNQMVYNRCVGTRYCSNNCPYKVRRFNFFNFRSEFSDGFYQQDSVELVNNPEVTVRSRGVMEKCTFCVQRIMEARQNAIKKGEKLNGSDIKTACQVACPTEAITFGDMNDPQSEISKSRQHNLGYHVLEVLNVRPNVTYIAKLRNIYSEES